MGRLRQGRTRRGPDAAVPARAPADDELLRALEADLSSALGALYDRYAGLVYGLALAILSNSQEAEDLTQEVFVALGERCTYDPARGSLGGFLVAMTRSRAIDRLRARRRGVTWLKHWRQSAISPESPVTPLEQVSLVECCRYVRNALDQLPDNQRRVLELAYYQGLSQAEIAARLGTPLGTVKSCARRGLLTLRRALEDVVG